MRQRCEYRLASLSGLPVGAGPVDGDRVDVRLVVDLMLAGGDGSRLAVSFPDKFRRPDVGHPNLDGSKPLRAQPLAMFAHSLATAVIGKDGKVVAFYPTNEWQVSDVLAQIRQAAAK